MNQYMVKTVCLKAWIRNDSPKHCKAMELPGVFCKSMCFQSHGHRWKTILKAGGKIVADATFAKLPLAASQKVIPSVGCGQRQNLVTKKTKRTQMY